MREMEKRNDQTAREEYEKRGVDFDETVAWHMKEGFVINVPYLFAMGYFYREGEKTILHLTMAVGEISFLFRFCLNYPLDFIEFQRNFSGKTKRYDYSKFTERLK